MLRPAPKGRSVTLDSLASSTGSGQRRLAAHDRERRRFPVDDRLDRALVCGLPQRRAEWERRVPLAGAGVGAVGRRAALGAALAPPPPPRDEAAPTLRTARVGTPARVVPGGAAAADARARAALRHYGLLALLFVECGDVGGDDPRRHHLAAAHRPRRLRGWKPDDDGIVGGHRRRGDGADGRRRRLTRLSAAAQLGAGATGARAPRRPHVHASASGLARTASSVAVHAGGAAERLRTKCAASATRNDSSTPSCARMTRSRRCTSEGGCTSSRRTSASPAALSARTPRSSYCRSPRSCLPQQVRHRFFLGRLARVINVITVDREYSFSTFLSPERALRAMLDVWEPMQILRRSSAQFFGIDEEDDAARRRRRR